MKIPRDADGKIHILSKVFDNSSIKKTSIVQIEGVAPELVKQFLTALGTQLRVDIERASKFAEEIVNYYEPAILWEKYKCSNNLYTLAELTLLQANYIVRLLDTPVDTPANTGSHLVFWKSLFPESWPPTIYEYEYYLPKLKGKKDEVEQAKHIRRFQLFDLLHLKKRAKDDINMQAEIMGLFVKTFSFLRNYDLLLDNLAQTLIDIYIDSVINRDKATDWLSTELVTYNFEWLKSTTGEADHYLKTVIKMMPKQLQALIEEAA